jgi:tellurite resistance protein TerC
LETVAHADPRRRRADHGTTPRLFPFGEYWWFYAGSPRSCWCCSPWTSGVPPRAHCVSFRDGDAGASCGDSLALVFNFLFYSRSAASGFGRDRRRPQTALEFLAGYVVEYSLSVDNIFVFVVVLTVLPHPGALQHRVLFFGILAR